MDSRIPGFYTLSIESCRKEIAERCDLDLEAIEALAAGALNDERTDAISENVIGTIEYPVGVATNFRINGTDRLIPMAVEETSVVAAASYGALMARPTGGFTTSVSGSTMIAQIQSIGVKDPVAAKVRVLEQAEALIEQANEQDPVLIEHGGGCKDIEARVVETSRGKMVVTHLLVDVRDAMGGNTVNSMAEALAPTIEEITGGEVVLRILSNLADHRLARATATIEPESLSHDDNDLTGAQVRDRIVDAWALASADPYRATTHNKGIMNGIDAVTTATFNDWRAIEAGAHSYAAQGGYGPLTTYEVDADGALACSIELPIQIGTIGGATQVQPAAKAAMEILDAGSADELAGIIAAVGLAQNYAGLRALVSEGIQTGHMNLHAKNIAIQAGASGDTVDEIAEQLVEEDAIRQDRAEELLKEHL